MLGATDRDQRLGFGGKQDRGVQHPVLLGARELFAAEKQVRLVARVYDLQFGSRATLRHLGDRKLSHGEGLGKRAVAEVIGPVPTQRDDSRCQRLRASVAGMSIDLSFPQPPMAIPFRVHHFIFRRQQELEAELKSSAIYRKLEALGAIEGLDGRLATQFTGSLRIPQGAIAKLDAALQAVKTTARLPQVLEAFALNDPRPQGTRVALLEGETLRVGLSPSFLNSCGARELAFHIGAVTFHALHPVPRHLWLQLEGCAPYRLEERLKAIEITRLGQYAADCLGLLCCGSSDVAAGESFRHLTGIDPASTRIDLDRVGSSCLESGELGGARLIESALPTALWSPVRTAVIKNFAESEAGRACLGEPGGTPRAEFEAAILELDRRAYPPLEELPEEHGRFVSLASLLSSWYILEASGPVEGERLSRYLEHFELEESRLKDIAGQLGWKQGHGGNTTELLKSILLGPRTAWVPIHAAHILHRAFFLMVRDIGQPNMMDDLDDVCTRLGQWCQLDRRETIAVYDILLDSLSEDAEED